MKFNVMEEIWFIDLWKYIKKLAFWIDELIYHHLQIQPTASVA